MAQQRHIQSYSHFVIENLDDLTKYISNIYTKDIAYNNINIRLKSVNLKQMNLLRKQTMLPLVIINIIDSYMIDEINVCVYRYISKIQNVNNRKLREQNVHIDYIFVIKNSTINFDTYSFQSLCCIRFNRFRQNDWPAIRPDILTYESLLNSRVCDNDIIEHKSFKYLRKRDKDTVEKYKSRHAFLKKVSVRPDKYFIDCIVPNSEFRKCRDMADCNLFFNCYVQTTQQDNNEFKIDHDTPGIKIIRKNKYTIEKCKYYKETDCYKQFSVNECQARMTQYKVINPKKFMNVLVINKLLYETVNTQMKNICIDNEKVQNMNLVHDSANQQSAILNGFVWVPISRHCT